MKIINNKNKKSFLKRLFIQCCRKLGYEIIDQNDLFLPTSNLFANQNLSKQNHYSINIPLGKVEIKRKVEDLTIIVRSYTSTEVNRSEVMLDQNKERVFNNPKIEYTLRTINSLIKSCNHAIENFKNIKINLIVTDDNSSKDNLNQIRSLLAKIKFKNNLVSLKSNEFEDLIKKKDVNGKEISKAMTSNMRNILKSIFLTKTDVGDLVYFVEDDYIHEDDALCEMIYSYQKISSQINDELVLCPSDYPYLYVNTEHTQNLIGYKRHWRQVNQSLCTYLVSKQTLKRYWSYYEDMFLNNYDPYEKPLHNLYKKIYCFSPMPSISLHLTNINSIYGLSPLKNWKELWDKNNYQ